MTYNLNSRIYTLLADTVNQTDVIGTTPVNTITGDDEITGTSDVSLTGIDLSSTAVLDMNFGNDQIWGISTKNPGVGLSNAGRLLMGFGNDTVRGEVTNPSSSGGTFNRGIDNKSGGLIDTGFDDDRITGISGVNGYGIYNSSNARITTSFGRDVVSGSGGNGFGIWNDGLIDTGFDDDVVRGISNLNYAGFGGSGLTQLGYGNDRSEGFGNGYFDGGIGSDRLLLPTGIYTVSNLQADGFYNVTLAGAATEVMHVKNYELIGSTTTGTTSILMPGVFNI